jgi:hypothetical protein
MNLLVPFLTPFVPLASRWAEEQETMILKRGRPLNPSQLKDAHKCGVAYPEKIRILALKTIRPPQHGLLGWASKVAKVFGPETAGCTYRHGILIRKDCENYRENRALFLHEFCHTAQYERYGTIHAFLVDYLAECVAPGYPYGPLEKQANRTAANIIRRECNS